MAPTRKILLLVSVEPAVFFVSVLVSVVGGVYPKADVTLDLDKLIVPPLTVILLPTLTPPRTDDVASGNE